MINKNDDYEILQLMQLYGGSFVQTLAELASCADPVNYAKLRETFANYFEEYGSKNFK